MIGNAVPPLIAEAVGQEILEYLGKESALNDETNTGADQNMIPKDTNEALQHLKYLLDLNSKSLRNLSSVDLVKGWASILFLYPGLHPDGSLETGEKADDLVDYYVLEGMPEDLLKHYYKVSGWPVNLVPIATEAWRRFENKEIIEEEFYFAEAQMAGFKIRNLNGQDK
jgi:hypothetical protein